MKPMQRKKRKNGTGTAIYLGKNRCNAWVARILLGRDFDGKPIYYDISSFETELEALVCLENYHKEPTPLYIKEEKYNRIVFFPKKPYPLVAVKDPKKELINKVKKENYTYKQLYDEFKKVKMLTKEEQQLEKLHHIRPKDKPYGRHYCRSLETAFHNTKELYNKVYKDLRASDFMNHLKNSGRGLDSQRQILNLFYCLDRFALEEDIIEKGYSQFVTLSTTNRKEIKKSKNKQVEKDKLFSYNQIEYLWNLKPQRNGIHKKSQQQREIFIRDFWLMLLYSGMRADELLSVYNDNVFLDDNYFVGGLKTRAGINREIPIHPKIKDLFKKYYNPENEFLFTQPNGKRIDYDYYLYHYKYNFKDLHPELSGHTAHDARHTLRNELRKLGIKEIIINSIIGHSNDDVGEDIYSHVSIEEKLEAIKMVTYKEKKLYILQSEHKEKTS